MPFACLVRLALQLTLNSSLRIASLPVPAVILPPLGVFLEKGLCDKDVLINILLTILGWIPGMGWPAGPAVVRLKGTPSRHSVC